MPVGAAVGRVLPDAFARRGGIGGNGDAGKAVAVAIGKLGVEQVGDAVAGAKGGGNVFGDGHQRGIAAEHRRFANAGDRHGDLPVGAGIGRAIEGLHGEGIERAIGVGGGRPYQFFTSGKHGGAGDNRHAILGQRAGAKGSHAEGQRIAIDISLVGRRNEVGVGDGEGGVFGSTGQGADGGEGGYVVDCVD